MMLRLLLKLLSLTAGACAAIHTADLMFNAADVVRSATTGSM